MINIFFIIIKKKRLRAIASEDEERDKDKVEEKFSTIFPLKSQMNVLFGELGHDYYVDILLFDENAYTIYWVPCNDERKLFKELPV